MLAARALSIAWGDTPRYWKWKTLPDSRFLEVAELLNVCWLEIRGVINTNSLSPNTHYVAYFVFKMINPYGFLRNHVELSVDISSDQSIPKKACLDPNINGSHVSNGLQGLQHPNVRSDGWLEIEMGEFFNSGIEDEVLMSVLETKGGYGKRGLVVEGIEVRPKEAN